MNIKTMLSAFRRQLMWEAAVRSVLAALTCGAASVLGVSLLYHLFTTEPPSFLLPALFLIISALTFSLIFFLRLRPSSRQVAARVDEIGLMERVGTMLEYEGSDTPIARIQRSDAMRHLHQVTPSMMRSRYYKKEFILCAVSILLCAVMVLLPYDLFFGVRVSAAGDQTRIVRELIDDLRDRVREAELEREQQKELEELVNDLEEKLRESQSELERAAQIQEAMEALEKMLEEGLTKNPIGEALQQYELTRPLGEAIENADGEGVSAALDELETQLNADTALISELADTIRQALADSGVDASDELYTALDNFAAELWDIAAANIRSAALAMMLKGAFDTAEEAILAALEKQVMMESQLGEMQEAMQQAKDEILGNEPVTQPETGEGENEQPSGEMPQDMPAGGTPPEGMPSDGGNPPQGGEGSLDGMTEEIYDPVSGSVAYGEVFAAYYREYLEALEDGSVPVDLQRIIDEYFAALE